MYKTIIALVSGFLMLPELDNLKSRNASPQILNVHELQSLYVRNVSCFNSRVCCFMQSSGSKS